MTHSGLEGTVTFCVGGTFFTTHRNTLMKEPGSRLSLMARGLCPTVQDAQGVLFVDRDPKFFQLLLNWLRDGWCLLPSSQEERLELLHEVQFHQLSGMDAWIRSQQMLSSSPLHDLMQGRPHTALPTVAYTGSPTRHQHTTFPHPEASTLPLYSTISSSTTPAVLASPSRLWSPGASGRQGAQQPPMPMPSMLFPAPAPTASSPASTRPSSWASGPQHPLRAVLREATAAGPASAAAPAYSLPQGAEGRVHWTAKYLHTNEGLREVANSILELAYLAPHKSLHAGKVSLRISCDCIHEHPSSLLSSEPSRAPHVVSVSSAAGWNFELRLRPGCDAQLFDKCNIAEFVQDNWFVLSAVLKDQFGVVLEEDTGVARPTCLACRKQYLAVQLTKLY